MGGTKRTVSYRGEVSTSLTYPISESMKRRYKEGIVEGDNPKD